MSILWLILAVLTFAFGAAMVVTEENKIEAKVFWGVTGFGLATIFSYLALGV